MHNLPGSTWMEALEEAANPGTGFMPQKTLREKDYDSLWSQPLVVRPKYKGDFLEYLKKRNDQNKKYVKKAANKIAADPTNIYDYSMPSELLKHQEHPEPRDMVDDFYEFNRTDVTKEEPSRSMWYKTREWLQREVPEMTQDKRVRKRHLRLDPQQSPHKELDIFRRAHNVVANYLNDGFGVELTLDLHHPKIAMMLSELEKSRLQTNTKKGPNSRPINTGGVTVRLVRAQPGVGRWTFQTGSGGERYITVFQFIQKRNVRDVNKLDVRVSCTCPSWLFWGAQYNAIMKDYLYGKIRPKFTRPRQKDPYGVFLVCKHVLACVPYVKKLRFGLGKPKGAPKRPYKFRYELEKDVPEEEIKIPADLMRFETSPQHQDIIDGWDKLTPQKRRNVVLNQSDPEFLEYLAHKFPDTVTGYAAERLRQLATKAPEASIRSEAREALRAIV